VRVAVGARPQKLFRLRQLFTQLLLPAPSVAAGLLLNFPAIGFLVEPGMEPLSVAELVALPLAQITTTREVTVE
jgi:hypothetical protein